MELQSGFTVPKDRQEVTVHVEGDKALSGSIFLEYSLPGSTPHQKIVSFLEDKKSFFPLLLKKGTTEFIHKKSIKLVEVAKRDQDEYGSTAISLMHVENVTVFLIDGSSFTGSLMAEVPLDRARLSDCLNLPDKFLNMIIDGKICYINKEYVRKVAYTPKS